MDELLQHLSRDDMAPLYPDGYDNVIAAVYNMLYYAVRDKADEIRVSAKTCVWSKGGAKIKDSEIPAKQSANYRTQLLRILDKDAIVQRCTRVTRSDDAELVLTILTRE